MCSRQNQFMLVAIILITNSFAATIKTDIVADQPKTDEEVADVDTETIANGCGALELDPDDFLSVFYGNATRSGKCYLACLLKKVDMLTSANQINIKSVMELDDKLLKLPDVSIEDRHVCDSDEIVDKCTDISDEDECEAAFKFLDCALNSCPESAELLSEEEEGESSKES